MADETAGSSGARTLDAWQRDAQDAIDPNRLERGQLQALYKYLLGPEPSGVLPTPQHVLARMLRLEVVQLAFAGASQDVEQEVELVQLSAKKPKMLTGVQLHHFGAFYRSSWRINDWLHGRMDGATHVVRMLLSAERLRQRAAEIGGKDGPMAAVDPLLEDIHQAAVSSDNDNDKTWLEEQWANDKEECKKSVERLLKEPPPVKIPRDRAGGKR